MFHPPGVQGQPGRRPSGPWTREGRAFAALLAGMSGAPSSRVRPPVCVHAWGARSPGVAARGARSMRAAAAALAGPAPAVARPALVRCSAQ
eukprot:12165084-Alexandrium_andersonii.AAC.1